MLRKKLPQINLGILAVTAIVFIAAILNVLTFGVRYRLDVAQASTLDSGAVLTSFSQLELRSLNSYKKLFASKKLFRPLIKSSKRRAKVLTIDDLCKDLILIGIIKQDVPEAIVKNRRTRQSYFIKRGASLGQLKVESVGDDQIVVSFKGSKKTLFIQ